ncbi:class I SAM-dependent methyltransferase [Catenulispora sp. NL8]|uniref:Class I SAM-dependent methyltransferase n=1 Tax=Catenulispora pinistramenti TaxID=2705254 RepID=A0ABS5L0B3_9ACTN|nr:class I SAM-dependent methyltransferase [Catenulispora pinistramenti]MBS2551754.1 class I SAM-dependent methyltransferase [Catenulispora pinistramenti]
MRYTDVIESLRASYDNSADRREATDKEDWKLQERAAFLARLRANGVRRLLEIGAGVGTDSLYFQEQGLEVVATDLSPLMVAKCREKGLDARVAGFLELGSELGSEPFDAVFAFNCLLHVPNADLPSVLENVQRLLRPGGLFLVAVYGGDGTEEIWDGDPITPHRFFSLRTDEQIQDFARESFEIVDFHTRDDTGIFRSQVLTLRRAEVHHRG